MILLEFVIWYRDFEIYTPDNCLHPGQLLRCFENKRCGVVRRWSRSCRTPSCLEASWCPLRWLCPDASRLDDVIRDGVTEDPEAWFRFVVYDLIDVRYD